jgi:hypothetical protein
VVNDNGEVFGLSLIKGIVVNPIVTHFLFSVPISLIDMPVS